MRYNISRRTFVKIAGATSAALLAKMSGLIPEAEIAFGGAPEKPTFTPIAQNDPFLIRVKKAAALSKHDSNRHGRLIWSEAYRGSWKGHTVALVGTEQKSAEKRHLVIPTDKRRPSVPFVVGVNIQDRSYKDVLVHTTKGRFVRGRRHNSDGTIEKIKMAQKVPGLAKPLVAESEDGYIDGPDVTEVFVVPDPTTVDVVPDATLTCDGFLECDLAGDAACLGLIEFGPVVVGACFLTVAAICVLGTCS